MLPNYSAWITDFMDSWKTLDGIKTTKLFSKDVQYYETPDGNPCATWEDILELWKAVSNNQKDISYSFEILCSNRAVCIINWKMERIFISETEQSKQKVDGIFQISLDKKGKCNFFKQWRYVVIARI